MELKPGPKIVEFVVESNDEVSKANSKVTKNEDNETIWENVVIYNLNKMTGEYRVQEEHAKNEKWKSTKKILMYKHRAQWNVGRPKRKLNEQQDRQTNRKMSQQTNGLIRVEEEGWWQHTLKMHNNECHWIKTTSWRFKGRKWKTERSTIYYVFE